MAAQDPPNPPQAPAKTPTAPSPTVSWNPALRHEKDDRPAASVQSQTRPEDEPSSEEEEDDDEDASEEEDEEDEEDEEAGPLQSAHVNGPKHALEGATYTPTNLPPVPVQPKSESSEEESDEESDEESLDKAQSMSTQRLAEIYEHQGETTALEDAVTESAELPLVADAEPTNDDWGDSDANFDIGEQADEAVLQTPHVEAVGTTVGDNVIGNTKIGGNAGEDLDWGDSEGKDDFFGGSPSQIVESAPLTTDTPGAHVIDSAPKSASQGDWGMDLDLDDDFLPDKDDAPVFQLSDDEGFLEDEPPAPIQSTRSGSSSASRYKPQTSSTAPNASPGTNPYAPHFASTMQNSQQRSNIAQPFNSFAQNQTYQQQQNTRPSMPASAQSFADKSKGGYASPYDMPDDIVTTRKRPAPRTAVSAAQPTPPPPRTSSMSSSTGPLRAPPPSNVPGATLSPPSSGHSMQASMTGMPPSNAPKPAPPAKTSSSDFFAELPMTSKPRPAGRYTPQQNAPSHSPPQHAPPQLPPKERTSSWSSLRNEILPDSNVAQPSLSRPDQLPMFPSQPSVPTRTNSLPPSTRYSSVPPLSGPSAGARYSPAPPSTSTSNGRYSPAPSQGSSRQMHAPRTSSPLAFHSIPQAQEPSPLAPETHAHHPPGHHVSQSADGVPRPPFRSPLMGVSEIEESGTYFGSRPPTEGRSGTPPLRSTPSSTVGSPRKSANYVPHHQPSSSAPPPRPHSQPPSAMTRQPMRSLSNSEQLTSAYGLASPTAPYSVQPAASGTVNYIPHRRQASLNYEAIAPDDERAADPLQRWRGHPIFTWGIGGTIVTSFPKQIPRIGVGASAPVMKCSPGEIKVHNVKDMFPLPEDIAKFPGPLKNKSKKKEVSTWLSHKIVVLDMQLKEPSLEHSLSPDELKRLEEKILLWKLLQVLLDNDGRLEGQAAEMATKKLLSPHGDVDGDADTSFSTGAEIVGRSRSNTANFQAEPIDARAVEDLQKMLAKGDREKAVWHAVDQRLWGHAMLLSSTLNRDIWRQVVQEFVRKEVKKVGHNNQALAVLYEVFAGNHIDCIDELVPASARAGFQMVSADGAGSASNALQGLEKWRETIALILNNRSEGDASALLSLGRLLAQYGRVEAAHVCFVFARSVVNISGADDAQADVVLLGADHGKYSSEIGIDMETVLLTEVYEFAMSLSSQGGSHILPHLQNYKLAHAFYLAENGYRADAQAYCDAIAAAMKATTRISPYYNASFIARLDDLTKRLSQTPKDGTSSWISKPSMDKVGSSLLSKFNSFIAGDEEGATSNQHRGAEVGPFASIAGDSPSITPSQSNADLYGAYAGYGAPPQPSMPSNSKYAPSNAYAPRTSSEQQRSRYEPGRPSLESVDGSTSMPALSESYMSTTASYGASQPPLSPPSHRTQAKAHSYSPLRSEHSASQIPYDSTHLSTPVVGESASPFGSFGGPPSHASFDEPPMLSENGGSINGYQPPSSTSYEAYNPDTEEEQGESQSRKKSFMDDDDDDDLMARAASLKSGGKSNADKKADDAFRKAAEADAQRDKDSAAAKKGGWFGGWFKKDPNAAPGAIKAKLGDENSFVYDPELKKWVNKKGGSTDMGKPSATPPPPRAGPPGARSASSGASPPMGPPMGGPLKPPTSMARSSSMPPPMAIPGSRASTPGIPSDNEGGSLKPPVLARPSFSATGSGPPSRPGTGMSNASSIDDLLGAPQARKGASSKKKKGGRYVDVMAQGN